MLSDALAVFALPGNEPRICMKWLDDFTVAETEKVFNNTHFLPLGVNIDPDGNDINVQQRAELIERYGTRPVHVTSIATINPMIFSDFP